VRIICTQEYEARLMAYEIVIAHAPKTADKMRLKALDMLEKTRKVLETSAPDQGEDSALHFVEKTIALLDVTVRDGLTPLKQ